MKASPKERPILFSGVMVRALLGGTKTQTRRVVKPQPVMYEPGQCVGVSDMTNDALVCPYGQPGDRLWVRETFSDIYGSGGDEARRKQEVMYRADGETDPYIIGGRWTPSIHMPRWASRILLEITRVRVERLQGISEPDAIAEGIEPNWIGDLTKGPNGSGGEGWVPDCGWRHYLNSIDGDEAHTPVESYRSLWESINGAGSWNANPWVWVVEFRHAMHSLAA